MPRCLPNPPKAPSIKDRVVNRLNRPLGIEVELSEWGSMRAQSPMKFSYRVVGDGSVQPSGKEMVLDPLVGDGFVQGVLELGELLVLAGAEVNQTCGLHVHVGAADFGFFDLRRLLRMFALAENEIYQELVDPSRMGNRYSRMLTPEQKAAIRALGTLDTAVNLKHAIIKLVYGDLRDYANADNPKSLARAWVRAKADKYGNTGTGHDSRYSGLNLVSWFHRGTIEFRMHQGTTATADLLHWPLFCGWFVELANSLTDRAVDKMAGVGDLIEHMPRHIGIWAENKRRAASPAAVA